MIPVRYRCRNCGKDLGVYWQGVGDENEPKPECECGNETNFSTTTDPNVVQFGW